MRKAWEMTRVPGLRSVRNRGCSRPISSGSRYSVTTVAAGKSAVSTSRRARFFGAASLLLRFVALRLALGLGLGFLLALGLLLVALGGLRLVLLRLGGRRRAGRGVGLRRLGERGERKRRGNQHRNELLKHTDSSPV